jgi:DNA-binding protein HU-beta
MSKSVTKSDLVNSIAAETGLKKIDAERALKAAVGAIESALIAGDKVTLVGFGTFSVASRAARTGRHPQTKAPMQIAGSKSIKFKAGKQIKDAVNK